MQRPKLFQVAAEQNYSVVLYYDNEEIKRFDCKFVLKEQGVFTAIHNKEKFLSLCTIMNGTLAWDISGQRDLYNCIDICPDTLYQDSVRLKTDPFLKLA